MSVQVRNRNNNATYVASSVDAHGQEVANRLGVMDAALPLAERLGAADIKRFLAWCGSVLTVTNTRLAEAEQQYVTEQADDPAVRQERDDSFCALLSSTIQVRDRVDSVFGSSALATYGLQEPAPRSQEPLQAYAKTMVMLLRQHPRMAVDDVGSEFDTVRAAGAVELKLNALDRSLGRMLVEKRELDAAMITRNAKMAEWERVYRGVSNALAGLYHLAGETELASRIRPTQRRMSGVESVTDEPVGDADAPAGDLPADDADTPAEFVTGAATRSAG
jgi:hypothetical protein